MGRKSRRKQGRNADSDTYRREMMTLASRLLEKTSGPSLSGAKQWEEFLEIHKLVENIREKQADMGREETPREDEIEVFMSWLKANKVEIDHVKIEQYPNEGFGLKALREIKLHQDMLAIPRKVMLTTDTARASVLGTLIAKDRVLQGMPNILLSVHLLCEKLTPDSFWQPYIKMLPRKYTTPLYFNVEELEMMKDSPALEDTLKQYKNIARQYAYFFKLFQSLTGESAKIPLKDHFIYDEYRWAVSTVMTRQNQIPTKDCSQRITALIPLWDLCNHADGFLASGFDMGSDALHCLAISDFHVGDQLHIFYGARPNSEMLIHDGFVIPDNKHDKISVKLGISKNDSLFAMKVEVLARLKLSASGSFSLLNSENPVSQDLLAFLRVFSMNEVELKAILATENTAKLQSLFAADSILSVENETRVWTFLDARLNLLMKMYKSSIQEDQATLLRTDISEHIRLVTQLKLEEKKILQRARDYVNVRKEAPMQKKVTVAQEEGNDGGVSKQEVNGAAETKDTDDTALGVEETAGHGDASEEERLSQMNLEAEIAGEAASTEQDGVGDVSRQDVSSAESCERPEATVETAPNGAARDLDPRDDVTQRDAETKEAIAGNGAQTDGTPQDTETQQSNSPQDSGRNDDETPQVNGTKVTESPQGAGNCQGKLLGREHNGDAPVEVTGN